LRYTKVDSKALRPAPLLATPRARNTFERTLEEVRQWYGFYIAGYVVIPEHFHLLLSEPERVNLAVALQILEQDTRQLREFFGLRPLLAATLL
jgi:putative transposase